MSDLQRFSGAAAIGTDLVVITVARDGDRFRICEDASAGLVMLDRSQGEMRRFAEDLSAFVDKSGVDKLLLRAAPGAGPHKGHPRLYKMEAALHLHPRLEVSMVTEATLAKWQRHSGALAPDVHPSVSAFHEVQLHRTAIKAACLSGMGWPHPSWCEHVK